MNLATYLARLIVYMCLGLAIWAAVTDQPSWIWLVVLAYFMSEVAHELEANP